MKSSKMQSLAGALVLATLLSVPGESQAACGSSQRVASSSAVCLDAGWDNNKSCFWGICSYSSTFWATSRCSGKVVAKVDIQSGTDVTWHLTYNGHSKNGDVSNHVRGIYCCRDISATNNCRTS